MIHNLWKEGKIVDEDEKYERALTGTHIWKDQSSFTIKKKTFIIQQKRDILNQCIQLWNDRCSRIYSDQAEEFLVSD